jgi:Ca2+-binding EF-hand superfamily protein
MIVGSLAVTGSATAEDEPEATVHRLIYLGNSGPLFLKLEMTINGRPITKFRREYIAAEFNRFDTDSDGSLNPQEASSVPSLGRSSGGQAILGDEWKSLDTTPQNSALSFDEVAVHYESFMGPPFSLTRRIQDQLLDVDLISQLDISTDRSVSHDELRAGPEALKLLDLDDDETISAAELAPLSDPAGRPAFVVESEGGLQAYPFVLLSTDADLNEVAKQIVEQYDQPAATETPANPDGELSASEIPSSFKQLSRYDKDQNRQLSISELVAALRSPTDDLAVTATMPRFGRPRVSQPELPDRAINFSIKTGAGRASDTVSFFRVQFLRIDADKNRYLDRQEFGSLGLQSATFKIVDRDGNDQVTVKEITDYLEERVTLSRLRVIMRVDLQRRSLFQILDSNVDRRLTRREFLNGPVRIAEFDANGNMALDASEIESQYRVTLELAPPGLIPNEQTMMQQNSNSPVLQGSATGPEWFQRMDLNQDGDVSRREFLGPQADFARLDTDGDDALTPDEALAAATDR